VLKGNGKDFCLREAQETAIFTIAMLFTSGNMPIPRYFNQARLSLIETDVSDSAIRTLPSQMFEHGKIHPCAFFSRTVLAAEFNNNVFDKEMVAIVYALQQSRHYVLGTEHKTTIFSDYQNLEYITKEVILNRRQMRWAEVLQEYNFAIIYRTGSPNQTADILCRCPVYTYREGGTTAISEKPMLGPDQSLEVGAMEIFDDTYKYIEVGALDIALLSSDQKEAIIQDAKLDEEYTQLCKPVSMGENIDINHAMQDEVLTCKGRIYVPEAMRKMVMKSEHDSKVAGHFSRDRTMELVSRNFFWAIMEYNVQQHRNKCNNCQ
jgi:hypothetical protein